MQITGANPNPKELVAYCSFGYMVLNAIASALREDNPVITYAPPVVIRILMIATGTGILGALLSVTTGTPWYLAAVSAITAGSAAWVTSGKRVTPGVSHEEAVKQKSGRPPALSSDILPPPSPVEPEPPKAA